MSTELIMSYVMEATTMVIAILIFIDMYRAYRVKKSVKRKGLDLYSFRVVQIHNWYGVMFLTPAWFGLGRRWEYVKNDGGFTSPDLMIWDTALDARNAASRIQEGYIEAHNKKIREKKEKAAIEKCVKKPIVIEETPPRRIQEADSRDNSE